MGLARSPCWDANCAAPCWRYWRAPPTLSFFLGERIQAIIIGVILLASIGLGFVNEYRAERASAALHSLVRHTAVVRRDGRFRQGRRH